MLKNKKLTLILTLVVVIVLAAGIWLLVGNKKDDASTSPDGNGSKIVEENGTKSLSQTFYIYDTVVNIKILRRYCSSEEHG
jgi:thiamine biosynthesis lipoprotein